MNEGYSHGVIEFGEDGDSILVSGTVYNLTNKMVNLYDVYGIHAFFQNDHLVFFT